MKMHGGGEEGMNAASPRALPLERSRGCRGLRLKRAVHCGVRHAGSPPTAVSSLRERKGTRNGDGKSLERASSAPEPLSTPAAGTTTPPPPPSPAPVLRSG